MPDLGFFQLYFAEQSVVKKISTNEEKQVCIIVGLQMTL
jgi:hypothetical protein